MNTPRLLRKGLAAQQKILRRFGFEVDPLSLHAALARSRSHTPTIRTVIDVGASNGSWSRIARRYYPEASFYLIEAQKAHEVALSEMKRTIPHIDYVLAAAGDRNGQVYFEAKDLFGGLASHTPLDDRGSAVPMVTIDSQVQERALEPPFLLKLDTHGFEVPIFDGAVQTLRSTSLIVVEAYNFTLTPETLRFHEMCSFLEARGFRCVDLCDPLHRPRDKAFWQMDLFFIPGDSAPFQSQNYE